MNNYLAFVRKYILEILFVILGCAAVGSLKGASVESWLRAEVSYAMPTAAEAGVTMPYMQGLFRLAADENMWYNLRYALVCGLAGAILALVAAGVVYGFLRRADRES